jgi:predicted O-methyltransferase YrrM
MAAVTDREIRSIPGWFFRTDWAMFRFALSESGRQIAVGNLAEIGAYLGKSAVLIGEYLRDGEVFTVIDLFGAESDDAANSAENAAQYPVLTKQKFEDNYRRVHGSLPTVIQAPSSEITEHAAQGRHRFVHVDGSHLYDHVAGDVAASRRLLADQGVVVFDDYRTVHAPGVAAAVWQAMDDGLKPFAVSETKLYATWGDAEPWTRAIDTWMPTSGLNHEVDAIAGHSVYRVWSPPNIVGRTAMSAFNLVQRLRA